jgi:predicted metal-dependent peptidase
LEEGTLTSGDGSKQEQFSGPPGGSQDTHIPAPAPITELEWKTSATGAALGAKAMGKLPAELERLVDEFVEPKKNWKTILADSITVCSGFDMVNWQRGHKRKMGSRGVFYPTRHSWHIPCVAIIEDTSGSISPDELSLFRGAMIEILTQCRPKETIIMSVSMDVTNHKILSSVEELEDWESKGGGGTDMEAGFRWLLDNDHCPEVCIVLTDGYTSFTTAPDFPVTWVSTRVKPEVFPYGLAIQMEE